MAKNGYDGILLRFKPLEGRADADLLSDVAPALRHADASVPPETVVAGTAQLSHMGILFRLDWLSSDEHNATWLTAFAQALSSAGRPGSLGPAGESWFPKELNQITTPVMTGFASYIREPDHAERPLFKSWAVDPDTTRALCAAAEEWTAQAGGQTYLREPGAQFKVGKQGVGALMHDVLGKTGSTGDIVADASTLTVRSSMLDRDGTVLHQLVDSSTPWPDQVRAVRAILLTRATASTWPSSARRPPGTPVGSPWTPSAPPFRD